MNKIRNNLPNIAKKSLGPHRLDSEWTQTSASSIMRHRLWREVMRRKRRTHSPEFKTRVVLAAIQGDLTMAERVKKFDVHANQITDWKKPLLSNAPDVFGKGAKKAEDATETIQELHARIGQLTMENDFSERGLERIHGPRGKKWQTVRIHCR